MAQTDFFYIKDTFSCAQVFITQFTIHRLLISEGDDANHVNSIVGRLYKVVFVFLTKPKTQYTH
jgi:hypothetical protein